MVLLCASLITPISSLSGCRRDNDCRGEGLRRMEISLYGGSIHPKHLFKIWRAGGLFPLSHPDRDKLYGKHSRSGLPWFSVTFQLGVLPVSHALCFLSFCKWFILSLPPPRATTPLLCSHQINTDVILLWADNFFFQKEIYLIKQVSSFTHFPHFLSELHQTPGEYWRSTKT